MSSLSQIFVLFRGDHAGYNDGAEAKNHQKPPNYKLHFKPPVNIPFAGAPCSHPFCACESNSITGIPFLQFWIHIKFWNCFEKVSNIACSLHPAFLCVSCCRYSKLLQPGCMRTIPLQVMHFLVPMLTRTAVRKYDAPIRAGIGAQRSRAATEIARQIYTALIKEKQIYAGIVKEYSQPDGSNKVIVDYKDDAAALNGEKKETII